MTKFLRGSNKFWLHLNKGIYEKFKHEMIDTDSWDDFEDLVEKHVGEFKVIFMDFDERLSKKVKRIISYFTSGKSKIMYILGARDSGKTCFSFWLAEQIHKINKHIRICYVGRLQRKDVLPEWCRCFDTIHEVPAGHFCIIDEMAIQYNARLHSSEENINLGQVLAISRHKNLSILAITQDPNMGEINVWRLRDMVVQKKSNTYELLDRDRKLTGTIKFWMFIKNWLKPTKQEQALFEYPANKKVMLFKYNIPDCWTEELSKAFKYVDVRATNPVKKHKQEQEEEYLIG